MHIEILASESLGVRGLCCLVKTGDRRIIIDPGIALGYLRHRLLPHPFQVAVGAMIRNRIIAALESATDIVITHFHGDHIPLVNANPYQLSMDSVAGRLNEPRLWAAGTVGLSTSIRQRKEAIEDVVGVDLPSAERVNDGPFRFSAAMPHGEHGNRLGTVMMTRIEGNRTVFVHASDIQLLEQRPIQQILDWKPDVVLAGGPPLYLQQLSERSRQNAWENALHLAEGVPTLILDHHLLRSRQGVRWLDRLNAKARSRVICAADFMGEPRRFLEAWRRTLYKDLPVPADWHEDYAQGRIDTAQYTQWREWDVSAEQEEPRE